MVYGRRFLKIVQGENVSSVEKGSSALIIGPLDFGEELFLSSAAWRGNTPVCLGGIRADLSSRRYKYTSSFRHNNRDERGHAQ